MKRIISIFLIFAISLGIVSCRKNENNQSWRIISVYCLSEPSKHGMFSLESDDCLNFIDFETMQESPVCDDPTCKHILNSGCTAYGKENHPFIYNNKLYYFTTSEMYQEDNKYIEDTYFWQSDLNGSNEKQIAEIKGLSIERYNRVLLDGNMLYMCMNCLPYDKDFNMLEAHSEFLTYNIDNGEIKNYGETVKGYSSGSWIYGLWDNRIIFSTSESADNRSYMDKISEFAKENNLTEEEAFAQFKDEYITKYFQFDLKDKKISKCDLPSPLEMCGGYYFYNDGKKLKYITDDNKTKETDLTNIESASSLGKYCILIGNKEMYIFNSDNEKFLKVVKDYANSSFVAEYEDSLIIQNTSDDGLSKSYQKVSVDEIAEKL